MSVARSLLYAAANVLHPRMLWLMLWPSHAPRKGGKGPLIKVPPQTASNTNTNPEPEPKGKNRKGHRKRFRNAAQVC